MNKKTTKLHFISWALTLALLLNLSCLAFAQEPASNHYDDAQIAQFINQDVNWAIREASLGNSSGDKLFTTDFLTTAGSTGDWWAFATGRAGLEENYAAYLNALSEKVSAIYTENNGTLGNYLTDYHRIILTILALGGDPSSFGTYDGRPINLIRDGLFPANTTPAMQGVNAVIFELLSLDAKDYIIPDGQSFTRDSLICDLLKEQTAEGAIMASWGVDPDYTCMAITALAPYTNSNKKYSFTSNQIKDENNAPVTVETTVKEAVDNILNYLSSTQLEGGAIDNWGPNPCTTAQAIIALSSVGIDCQTDERFIKNGNTFLSALLDYQYENGGFGMKRPSEGGNEDAYTSSQAFQALTAYQRFVQQKTSLYDYKEGSIGLDASVGYPTFDYNNAKIDISGSFTEDTTAFIVSYQNGVLTGTHIAALEPRGDSSYQIDFSGLENGYDSLRLLLWDNTRQLSPKTDAVSSILR